MNRRNSNSTTGFLPQAATTSAPPIVINNTLTAATTSNPQQHCRDVAYIWSSLFAGVGSGALASVACAPLDLLRTRMQVWGDLGSSSIANTRAAATTNGGAIYFLTQIAKTEGWRGYFRGLGATLATVPLFWGLYFPLYDDLKRTLGAAAAKNSKNTNSKTNQNTAALIHCVSAMSAGAVADVICNPMFVVRTRLQTEALHQQIMTPTTTSNKKAVLSIAQTISVLYKEGGIAIFWRGLTASMLGLSHVGVQFPVYEWLKEQARSRRRMEAAASQQQDYHYEDGRETPLDLLLASGLSKMTASLLTYPHEVIRSRMMDSRNAGDAGFINTFGRIHAKEGWRGFYSGLHVSLIRVVPNCCVTFLTYELLLRWAKDQLEHSRGGEMRRTPAMASNNTTTTTTTTTR